MNGVTRRRNAALDGLRGIAALAVLWAHVIEHLGLMPIPPLGGMGVLVFFVLSGYLIARIVARAADGPYAYRRFLGRRVVRLGPAIAALAVAAPVLLVAMDAADVRQATAQAVLALTQTTAFATASGMWVHPALAPTWSLTVEWTFYLLFPVAYLVAIRRGHTPMRLARETAIVAGALYLAGLLLPAMAFYHLPVANLGVMVLGAALGLAHHAGWTGPERLRLGIWPAGGLAMILVLTFLPGSPLAADYRFAVLPATALATALVINGCVAGHPVQRILASRFLRTVGLRAYSLYLWHMSVLWLTWRLRGDSASWTTAGIACLALIPIVELSYRLLEAPVLRGGTNALQPHSDAGSNRRALVERG